ncbi:glycosyltransferase family 2 protein [Pseudoalteromonas agarivorans]|uniref:glycosyltransferase family 2 protein n=1 Tax=Pseudoalteromonas agarivorans TaxID=176102 RepID=UPI00311DB126
MFNNDTIAVIIAAYNAEKTIIKAVESVVEDEFVSQVIVVDDCSTDNTMQLINSLQKQYSKISVFTTELNSGPAKARNIALSNCISKWITVLDSDDYIERGRFEKLLAYSEGQDLIADDKFRINENDSTTGKKTMLGDTQKFPVTISLSDFIESNITKKGEFRKELGFIKPLIRRQFIIDHNLKYQENMRLGEDYELYCRCLIHGANLKLIEASGYVAVVRQNSLSGRHTKKDLVQLRDCDYELAKIESLTPNERKLLLRHAQSINIKIQWICFYSSIKNKHYKATIKSITNSLSAFIFILKNLKAQFFIRVVRRRTNK